MKKKLLIIVLVLLMLITSFFVLTKKPKIKYKKLKELNYNVTYKQAFPDENLRRSVVLCIMRDKCNNLSDEYYYKDEYYKSDTRNFLNDPKLGPEITEEELKAKEEEQLSKQALDKIKNIVPNDRNKKITTLQGIEYLTNLLKIDLPGIEQENLDFSYNKELEILNIKAYKANSINLERNLKLKHIDIKLSINEKNLDLSHLTALTFLYMDGSGIKNIKLPNGIVDVYLGDNNIKEITIPSSVKKLSLYNNSGRGNIESIILPEGIKEVSLGGNKIREITVPSTVTNFDIYNNLLTSIILPEGVEYASISQNKIENITIPSTLKTLYAYSNNIKNITLSEGINRVDLSNNKIEEIIIPSTVESLELNNNKISNIDLPTGIKYVSLNNNKISNIDLSKNNNLLGLGLYENPLENIDVKNNPNLLLLNFSLKNSKDTIDFSNNPKLSNVLIEGNENGKIKSLDFSNNPDLRNLKLKNLDITNLNIEKNIELRELYLENNNLNTIDLSENKNIWSLQLYNNNTQNIKLPIKHIVRVGESRKIKVKKNSYITIPRIFYNDKEYFLNENSNYEKVGDKYVFKNIGTHRIDATVYWPNNGYDSIYWHYTFEVENGEEDSFNPNIDQGNYIPLINEEIPVNNLKEMITNLPANIKNFEIISPNTFPDKGDKSIKVRITFSDDTFKEVDIPIKVYEKEDILPTVTVTPETLEILDKKSFNINITRFYAKEDNVDNTNFIKTVRDNLVSYEYLNKANGLTYNSNGIAGVIDYLFTGTEEEHTFNITYKEQGKIYTFNKNITIKLLRDTDKDGIPDKDDDDKDGDGYSNAVEIARGSDPYNKDSLPDMSKKDELDNLVKQLEKLIEDTKNNPFDTKNKIDVDNLKNNFLPGKVTEKDNIKGSYSATTSDTELLKLIEKTKKEIDDIKKEINKLRDKANFEELDKEINKAIDNSYVDIDIKPLIDKIKEAKDLDRNTATQEEVDKLTKEIKELREKIIIDKTKLKEKIKELEQSISDKLCKSEECKTLLNESKSLYDKTLISKKEMFDMIDKIDDVLKKNINNPNTGIKTYSLVIVLIIFISYLVFKKKKSYIR